MSDIVQELLSRASDEDGIGWTPTTVIPVPARLLHHAADRIEQLEAALDILQAAMTAKKPIPMAFKKAILEARAALEEERT